MRFAFIFILLLFAVACKAQLVPNSIPKPPAHRTPAVRVTTMIPPDAAVRRFLGNDLLRVIQRAERINTYLLDPFAEKPDSNQMLAGFPIFQEGMSLNVKQTDEIRRIVFSASNYGLDSIVKNCLFTPGVGLEFVYRTEVVYLLICTDCDEWRFVYKDKTRHEDCDPARTALVPFVQTLFPCDELVRQLKISNK